MDIYVMSIFVANIIFLFHSVLKEGEENYNNTWSYDFDKFNLWLDYVLDLQSQGKLEIMTTMEYREEMYTDKPIGI